MDATQIAYDELAAARMVADQTNPRTAEYLAPISTDILLGKPYSSIMKHQSLNFSHYLWNPSKGEEEREERNEHSHGQDSQLAY